MAEKEYILTPQGKVELEEELDHLRNVTRKEVSAKIKEARSFGDLSENAEYDEAKKEQAEVESRIQQLEHMLKFAKVVDDSDSDADTVTLGKRVVLKMMGEETEYSVVGTSEADPYKNKISYESPVGAAILNHKAGESVTANTPAGELSIEILAVEK